MSDTVIQVSYAELTNSAETLRQLAQQLRDNLEDTRRILTSNVGSDDVWNSEAAMKYRKQFEALAGRTFDDFEFALKKTATFLDETVVKAYQKAEQSIASAAEQNLVTGYDQSA